MVSLCRPSIAGFRELRVFDHPCALFSPDRTRNGCQAAVAHGVKFGPPSLPLAAAQIAHMRQLIDGDGCTGKEITTLLGVHRQTLYRALARTSTSEAICENVFTHSLIVV